MFTIFCPFTEENDTCCFWRSVRTSWGFVYDRQANAVGVAHDKTIITKLVGTLVPTCPRHQCLCG